MEGCSSWYSGMPNNVDEIYEDFKRRREGIIKALTADFEELYQQCDPKDESFLGLYGLPDESWKVLPEEEGFPMLPNPVWGINNKRLVMTKKNWRYSVADNSHVWLHAIALFHCARVRLSEEEKGLLLGMVGSFQAVEEAVKEAAEPAGMQLCIRQTSKKREFSQAVKEAAEPAGKQLCIRQPSKKRKFSEAVKEAAEPAGKQLCIRQPSKKRKFFEAVVMKIASPYQSEDECDEENEARCPICREMDGAEKWILCDICEEWLHCRCVNISSEEADAMEEYICPFCCT